MKKLQAKVAIVTGATSGIGTACAKIFAREGAKVVLCGRNAEKGTHIAAQILAEKLFLSNVIFRMSPV